MELSPPPADCACAENSAVIVPGLDHQLAPPVAEPEGAGVCDDVPPVPDEEELLGGAVSNRFCAALAPLAPDWEGICCIEVR